MISIPVLLSLAYAALLYNQFKPLQCIQIPSMNSGVTDPSPCILYGNFTWSNEEAKGEHFKTTLHKLK